jgi:NADH-quinone oxidoreductase subunit L
MAVSSVVALAGIAIATYFFLKRRDQANVIADRLGGLRKVLLEKYYVDELYDTAIVQPIRLLSEDGLWKVLDVRAIDGAVNGVGGIVRGSSELLRRLQTGSVRTYAASLFFGVVLVLGYYLWR